MQEIPKWLVDNLFGSVKDSTITVTDVIKFLITQKFDLTPANLDKFLDSITANVDASQTLSKLELTSDESQILQQQLQQESKISIFKLNRLVGKYVTISESYLKTLLLTVKINKKQFIKAISSFQPGLQVNYKEKVPSQSYAEIIFSELRSQSCQPTVQDFVQHLAQTGIRGSDKDLASILIENQCQLENQITSEQIRNILQQFVSKPLT